MQKIDMIVNRKIQPKVENDLKISYLEPENIQLSNGIKVYGLNAGSQEILKIEFIFNAGSWFQSENLVAGLSNAFLNEGTANYTAEQIAEAFDFYGAYLQLSADQHFGYVSILTLNHHIDKIIEITSDVIKHPIFPQTEIQMQLNKRKQRFTVENEKAKTITQKRFTQVVFGNNHPYANTNLLADFDNVNSEKLERFHKQYYTSDNCYIIVAGRYDASLYKLFDRFFGGSDWGSSSKLIIPTYNIEPSAEHIHFIEKKDTMQSSIRVGREIITRTHPDFGGVSILATVLGGYFGSRLMLNIREDKGFTYGIGANLYPHATSGYLVISSEVGNDVCRQALDEVYKEIEILRNELITNEELALVKNYLMGEMVRSFDGIFAISHSLKTVLDFNLTYTHYEDFIEELKNATPIRMQELANKYLQRESFFEVVAGAKS